MRFISTFACIGALAAGFVTAPAFAGANFDGTYSVAITTERGNCEAASWSVAVNGGRIADSGMFVQSAGYVDGRGRVILRVTHGSDILAAAGALNGETGGGTWQSPTRQCSGRWRAVRS